MSNRPTPARVSGHNAAAQNVRDALEHLARWLPRSPRAAASNTTDAGQCFRRVSEILNGRKSAGA